jgi:ribosomal protein L37AE/L43A
MMVETKQHAPPVCPYCGSDAVFHKSSAKFYRGRDYGSLWACEPCQAWVGVHGQSKNPLGRLANAELRKLKMAAHSAFDPLWKKGGTDQFRGPHKGPRMRRSDAYGWLAQQLGIAKHDCHIGLFDESMCKRVIEVCNQLAEASAA